MRALQIPYIREVVATLREDSLREFPLFCKEGPAGRQGEIFQNDMPFRLWIL